MKILVIGGTLFIGRLLVDRLLAEAHEVTILHRRPGGLWDVRLREAVADRNDAASVRQAVAGERFDAVFDNVYDWERGTTAEQVAGTALAVADGLQRYLFISSIAAYGSGLHHAEEDPLAPEDDADLYVRNKANSERALFKLHREQGLPVVTFRPPFIYGRGNPFYREAFFWDRLLAGRPILVPGDGQRLMQFVLVNDLVQAMLTALTEPRAVGKAFNVANPHPITQTGLVLALAEVAGIQPELIYVPREEIEAAGGNAMAPPLYFGTYFDLPPITEVTTRAEELLGFAATPFLEGLREQYQQYFTEPKRPLDTVIEDRLFHR